MIELFLGVPYKQKPLNQALFDLFTKKNPYLSLYTFKENTYLGKVLPLALSYEELLDQKKHISSIIRKILPEINYLPEDLVLIASKTYEPGPKGPGLIWEGFHTPPKFGGEQPGPEGPGFRRLGE